MLKRELQARMIRIAWLAFAAVLAIPVLSLAEGLHGRVVGVADGDTITEMHQGRGERIRLYGIDAPERGQPFNQRAKQFVSELCYHKEVRVKVKGQDGYQGTVADVILRMAGS